MKERASSPVIRITHKALERLLELRNSAPIKPPMNELASMLILTAPTPDFLAPRHGMRDTTPPPAAPPPAPPDRLDTLAQEFAGKIKRLDSTILHQLLEPPPYNGDIDRWYDVLRTALIDLSGMTRMPAGGVSTYLREALARGLNVTPALPTMGAITPKSEKAHPRKDGGRPPPESPEECVRVMAAIKGAWSIDEATKFFQHYAALGWKKQGQPIHDWTYLASTWMGRAASGEFERRSSAAGQPAANHLRTPSENDPSTDRSDQLFR